MMRNRLFSHTIGGHAATIWGNSYLYQDAERRKSLHRFI